MTPSTGRRTDITTGYQVIKFLTPTDAYNFHQVGNFIGTPGITWRTIMRCTHAGRLLKLEFLIERLQAGQILSVNHIRDVNRPGDIVNEYSPQRKRAPSGALFHQLCVLLPGEISLVAGLNNTK
jgi:hypothetical protein